MADKTCNTCKCNKVCDHNKWGFENCDNYISDEAVEVVRCEKCKHGEVSIHRMSIDGEEEIGCYCELKGKVTDIDGFCSCGERRTDNDLL